MKEDLRVIKTRAAIDAAFLQLLEEKPYSDISIRDIAERAIISRNTFYLHYSDKAALIEDFCDRLLKKIQNCFADYPLECVATSPEGMRQFASEFMKSIYDEKSFVLLAIQILSIPFGLSPANAICRIPDKNIFPKGGQENSKKSCYLGACID